MLVLSHNDLTRVITMADALPAMRLAFGQLAAGEADVPLRASISNSPRPGVTLFMPALLAGSQALGCKVVSVRPENVANGLPLIHALVVLIDVATGRPLAAMDGRYLTALRTGAASGVATDLLARPDASVLACFGAGAQAEMQIEAVCAVRHTTRVWIKSRSTASAARFIEKIRGRPGVPDDLRAADSPAHALAEADIICTATTSATPVFDGRHVRPGTHINAIGSYTLEMQEVDAETVRKATIVVDSRTACEAEAGDLLIPLRQGLIGPPATWTELGEIISGRSPGRRTGDEVTFFKSVGSAAQDVAVAQIALERAERQGLGVRVALSH